MRKYLVCCGADGRKGARGGEGGGGELSQAVPLPWRRVRKIQGFRRCCSLALGVVGFQFPEKQKVEGQEFQQRRTLSESQGGRSQARKLT